MHANPYIESNAANNVSIVKGIKGLASGVFFDNLGPSFLEVSMRSWSQLNCHSSITQIYIQIYFDKYICNERERES